MYPRLLIDLKKIKENACYLYEMLTSKGIDMVGVTKLFMGHPKIANCFKEAGVEILADSRFENIDRMISGGISSSFMMIRIPPMSHIPYLLKTTEYFLVSEPEVAKFIDSMADKPLKLIYMVDVGDLREGVMHYEAVDEIKPLMAKLKKAKVVGIGCNVGCFGGVLPSVENLNYMVEIAKEIGVGIISVGGTVYLKALEEGFLPKEVNQIRIGEAALLGTDTTGNRVIPYLSSKTVVLEAEVIEVKLKPSKPFGPIGLDAMGREPEFEDKGKRLKAIVAVGEQDVNPLGLTPEYEGAYIIHASSDHMIIDITDVKESIKVGDILRFYANYSATLRAVTSPYVEKVYIDG